MEDDAVPASGKRGSTGKTGARGAKGETGAVGPPGADAPPREQNETLVVSTEDGIVLTGNRMEAFEARVMGTLRKPFYLIFGLIVLIFVILLGGSVFLSRLDGTVNNVKSTVKNTDTIVNEVAGPEARKESAKQQAQFIEQFSQGLNCDQQNNLQRLIDQFIDHGLSVFEGVNVIKPPCTKEE